MFLLAWNGSQLKPSFYQISLHTTDDLPQIFKQYLKISHEDIVNNFQHANTAASACLSDIAAVRMEYIKRDYDR